MENNYTILIVLISLIPLIFIVQLYISLKNNKRITDMLSNLSTLIDNFNKNHIEFDKSIISNVKELNNLVVEIKKVHSDSLVNLNATLFSSLSEFNDKVNKYFDNNKNYNHELNKLIIDLNSSLNGLLSDYNDKANIYFEKNNIHNQELNILIKEGLKSIDNTLKETINVE